MARVPNGSLYGPYLPLLSILNGLKPDEQKCYENKQKPRVKREGVLGFAWKLSRIGERLSPWVGAACVLMAIHVLILS